jgi:hypothetical protein
LSWICQGTAVWRLALLMPKTHFDDVCKLGILKCMHFPSLLQDAPKIWGQGLLPHAKPLISDCPWALLYSYFTTSLLQVAMLSHPKALRGVLLCMYLEGTLYPWIWILDSCICIRSLALLSSTHKFPPTTSQSRYV